MGGGEGGFLRRGRENRSMLVREARSGRMVFLRGSFFLGVVGWGLVRGLWDLDWGLGDGMVGSVGMFGEEDGQVVGKVDGKDVGYSRTSFLLVVKVTRKKRGNENDLKSYRFLYEFFKYFSRNIRSIFAVWIYDWSVSDHFCIPHFYAKEKHLIFGR